MYLKKIIALVFFKTHARATGVKTKETVQNSQRRKLTVVGPCKSKWLEVLSSIVLFLLLAVTPTVNNEG